MLGVGADLLAAQYNHLGYPDDARLALDLAAGIRSTRLDDQLRAVRIAE